MPPRTALIGYTGFVGKNLMLQTSFTHLYNSKNFQDMTGQSFDSIICCGVSATKWLANKHPDNDWQQIQRLVRVLETVQCSQFILISTIDVYASTDLANTETHHHGFSTEPYGLHRKRLEDILSALFPSVLIVRLPALFGSFLKKNIVYDMLENTQPQVIYLDDRYQFYYLRHLYDDIQRAIDEGLRTINLFPEAVSVQDLYTLISTDYPFPSQIHTHSYQPTSRKMYNCSSDVAWCRSSASRVLDDFKAFLYRHAFWKHFFTVMPLCISGPLDDTIRICHEYGIHRFEVAPNHVWGGEWHTSDTLDSCIPHDEIVVLHAILYPYEWNVWNEFGAVRSFFEHIRSQCTRHLVNVHDLTMGSPRNRQRQGNATSEIGIALREYNALFRSASIFLNWELNAPSFGTDTFDSVQSCKDLSDEDPRNGSLTLDTGSCTLIGTSPSEFWRTFRDKIRHIHFSSFHSVTPPNLYDEQVSFFHTLVTDHYTGYITVEITPRCSSVYDYLRSVY